MTSMTSGYSRMFLFNNVQRRPLSRYLELYTGRVDRIKFKLRQPQSTPHQLPCSLSNGKDLFHLHPICTDREASSLKCVLKDVTAHKNALPVLPALNSLDFCQIIYRKNSE